MRTPLKICVVFLIWLAIFPVSLALAKTPKFESFGDQLFYSLEQSVEARYSIEELAQIKSQVLDVTQTLQVSDTELKLYLASVWTNQGYLAEANEVLTSIEDAGPYNELLNYYKCMVLMEIGQGQAAAPLLEELLQKYPNDADIQFLKSHILAQAQNYLAAIEALKTNLNLRQKKGKTYLQLGLLYIVIFDYNAAVRSLREALRNLDKKEIYYRQMAHFQLGLVYLKYFNKKSQANQEFLLGQKLDPTSLLVRQLDQNLAM